MSVTERVIDASWVLISYVSVVLNYFQCFGKKLFSLAFFKKENHPGTRIVSDFY